MLDGRTVPIRLSVNFRLWIYLRRANSSKNSSEVLNIIPSNETSWSRSRESACIKALPMKLGGVHAIWDELDKRRSKYEYGVVSQWEPKRVMVAKRRFWDDHLNTRIKACTFFYDCVKQFVWQHEEWLRGRECLGYWTSDTRTQGVFSTLGARNSKECANDHHHVLPYAGLSEDLGMTRVQSPVMLLWESTFVGGEQSEDRDDCIEKTWDFKARTLLTTWGLGCRKVTMNVGPAVAQFSFGLTPMFLSCTALSSKSLSIQVVGSLSCIIGHFSAVDAINIGTCAHVPMILDSRFLDNLTLSQLLATVPTSSCSAGIAIELPSRITHSSAAVTVYPSCRRMTGAALQVRPFLDCERCSCQATYQYWLVALIRICDYEAADVLDMTRITRGQRLSFLQSCSVGRIFQFVELSTEEEHQMPNSAYLVNSTNSWPNSVG
ncbi:hypothetical protein IW262DRAFT_1486378 [Armillaria fumosa]|nr:hypothetical protein IW262DRAFT_1486378 [Armillaria fumosa]